MINAIPFSRSRLAPGGRDVTVLYCPGTGVSTHTRSLPHTTHNQRLRICNTSNFVRIYILPHGGREKSRARAAR